MFLSSNIYNNNIHITLKPVKYENKNCNIIFVIDISGSMDIIASGKNENGECDDLTRLNLACHSIKTIIESLTDNDEIGIISFNHLAYTNLKMTKMDQEGKETAKIVINNLGSNGGTNIYEGLKKSFELLETIINDNNNSIVLLTDGVSNSDPPNGILNTLIQRFDSKNLKPFSLNTFGFSYDINSILLNDIANYYNGIFGFIPDCSMVGTVFINFISNLLTTYLTNIKMIIKFKNNTEKIINTGAILYESHRDFIIENEDNDEITSIDLYYNKIKIDYTLIENENENENENKYKSNKIRMDIINTIRKIINNINNNLISNNEMIINNLYNSIENENEEIQNYLKDYINDGQIKLALCRYFRTWGKHYLLSLMHGYDKQLCINFKDNGVQNFITKPFTDIRDKLELIFCNITPPQPKIIKNTTNRISSMEGYYRSDSVCFDGEGFVLLSNNTLIKINELKKGDRLFNMNNIPSKVECVIKQNINEEMDVCVVNDILISPYHPIFVFNKWTFPAIEFKIQKKFITSFYNIVLDNNDTIVINYIPVITLGHNLNANPTTKHDYFGTCKIRDDLKLVKGYNEGLIECKIMQPIRCPETNNVIKINVIFENEADNITINNTSNVINNTSNITNNTSNNTSNNISNTSNTSNTSNITNVIDNISNTIDNTSNTSNTSNAISNTSNNTSNISNTSNNTSNISNTSNITNVIDNISNTSNVIDNTSNVIDNTSNVIDNTSNNI